MRDLICHLAVGIGTVGLLCAASGQARAGDFWRPYDDLKSIFDVLHSADNHMLTLRQEGGTP